MFMVARAPLQLRTGLCLGVRRLVPDSRSLIVLASLVAAMTVVSLVLLLLDPGPVAPPIVVALRAVDRGQTPGANPEDILFDNAPATGGLRWNAIVIHDTGTTGGSLRTINKLHEKMGLGGIAYHFVIDNGRGEDDGLIEASFRWTQQIVGAFSTGYTADWLDERHAIGICLVGDGSNGGFTDAQMQRLVWLVTRLQQRFGIPRDQVIVNVATDPSGQPGPGRLFPLATFRQQLLP